MSSKVRKCTSVSGKRKHVTLTIHQKLNIICRLENGENKNNIMKEFNIASSTIYDIKKQKGQLEKFLSESATSKSIDIRQTLKKPKLETLDTMLYKWFSARRSEDKPITGPMIIEKAKYFHKELHLPESTMLSFSKGWLHNFKVRHGIPKLDILGKIKSVDEAAANEYRVTFQALVNLHKLSPFQIYNAVETGLLWCCLPNSTLLGAEELSTKGFKKNRDRLTVLVCANASGDHKVTPFVIGKHKKPSPLNNVTNLPVIYEAQSNAWMTEELFKDWFFQHFVSAVKANFERLKLPIDTKVLLVLDNCRAHTETSKLVPSNIFTTYLPPNVTTLIQPMDQGVIQNFKYKYRKVLVQRFLDSGCSVKDFQQQFNIKDAIFAAAIAWSGVNNVTLVRAWRKLWPKATELNFIENIGGIVETTVIHSQISDTIKSVSSNNPLKELSEDEIIEWMDIDKYEPTEEELGDEGIIKNPRDVQEVESDEEDSIATRISWSEAADAIKTFVTFAENSKHYNIAEVMNLHVLQNDFFKKRTLSKKQIETLTMFKEDVQ